MIRIFGDKIDDKIFPKKIKRFTEEEKNLITKFVNSILRGDKNSELESSDNEPLYDQISNITDSQNFIFSLKKRNLFSLTFGKFYKSGLKEKDYVYHTDIGMDGLESWDTNKSDEFKKQISKEKVLTGIYVWCRRGKLPAIITDAIRELIDDGGISMYLKDFIIGERPGESNFVMRTRYQNVESGGSRLTNESKERIQNFHFEKIFKIIDKVNKNE